MPKGVLAYYINDDDDRPAIRVSVGRLWIHREHKSFEAQMQHFVHASRELRLMTPPDEREKP